MDAADAAIVRGPKSGEPARRLSPANQFPLLSSPSTVRCTNRKSRPRKSDRDFGLRHGSRSFQGARSHYLPSCSDAKVSNDHAKEDSHDRPQMDPRLTPRPLNSADKTEPHSKSYWRSCDTIRLAFRSSACPSIPPTPTSGGSHRRHTYQTPPADRSRYLSFSTCAGHVCRAPCR